MLELIYREGAVAPTLNFLFCRRYRLLKVLLQFLRIVELLGRLRRLFLYRLAFFHLLNYIYIIQL